MLSALLCYPDSIPEGQPEACWNPVQSLLKRSCLHHRFTSQSLACYASAARQTNGHGTLGARSALDNTEEHGAAGGVDGLREPLLLLHVPGRRVVQLLLPPPLVLLHAHAAVRHAAEQL